MQIDGVCCSIYFKYAINKRTAYAHDWRNFEKLVKMQGIKLILNMGVNKSCLEQEFNHMLLYKTYCNPQLEYELM